MPIKSEIDKSDYEVFLEDYNKTYFVSVLSEYARNCIAKHSQVLGVSNNILFKKILSLVLNTKDKRWLEHDFLLGEVIDLKHNKAFIHGFERNKKFKFIFKMDKQFHVYTYELQKLSSNVTKLTYKHKVRWRFPIVGLNGFLAKRKFRKEHNNESIKMFDYLRKIFTKKVKQQKPK